MDHKNMFAKKRKTDYSCIQRGPHTGNFYALNQLENENRLPDFPYYVDSPLSLEATEVIESYPQYFNSRVQKLLLN